MTDYLPFTEDEYDLARRFLFGHSAQLEALNAQLDSLRYQSPLYKQRHFLGFPYRPRTIARRTARLLFKVRWGAGAEGWDLGDRRQIVLNDVVARLKEGRYLWAELVLDAGRLKELRVLGTAAHPGAPLEPFRGVTRSVSVEAVYFCPPWDPRGGVVPATLSDDRLPQGTRLLHPPTEIPNATEMQRWLLSLDPLKFVSPGMTIPLAFRRALPATPAEIAKFETENRLGIPGELRDFWLATNGASLFGDVIYGTYDCTAGRTNERMEILFLARTQRPGEFVIVEGLPEGSASKYEAVTCEIDIGTQETLRSWSSLRECLESLVNERRALAQDLRDRTAP